MPKPSLTWLLIFIPVALGLEHARPEAAVWIFFSACLAIIPLAALLGKSTEGISERAGEAIGGFLNATLGNAAELIIAIVALKAGQIEVVKASLIGSLLGNVLLVLGAAFLAGGIRHHIQNFNPVGALSQATNYTLAAIALVIPAAFQRATQGKISSETEGAFNLSLSILLLIAYLLYLVFSLKTHRGLFSSDDPSSPPPNSENPSHGWSLRTSLVMLGISAALIAWMSEILVGSVEQAAHTMGMSKVFVGVIIVAVVGNAAEHSTAILMAMKNRLDLSFGIATGSSIQIALFVAPFLVILGHLTGRENMDLVFPPGGVLLVLLSALILGQVSSDGKSTWFKGVQLLTVYTIIALALYFIP